MASADELPVEMPPLADVEAAASGADAGSSLMDLLLDEDDVPAAAQLSQAQIIESQARTLAELTKKVEAGDEYRRLTKSKLKEAAARLREYRVRVEELTVALTKAEKQKPAQAPKPKAPPPMRDAVTQTLPPVRRDMTTQTLQAIQPPVAHCSTQTLEKTQDAVAVEAGTQTQDAEDKPDPMHVGVQTLPLEPSKPKTLSASIETQTTAEIPVKAPVLVACGIQTETEVQQPMIVTHSSSQTHISGDVVLQSSPRARRESPRSSPSRKRKRSLDLAKPRDDFPPMPSPHQAAASNGQQADAPVRSPVHTVQAADAISAAIDDELSFISSEEDESEDDDESNAQHPIKNAILVEAHANPNVQELSPTTMKPLQFDDAISNAIDDELDFGSSDSDEDDDDAVVEREEIESKKKTSSDPVDVITAAIEDELASSSDENDQDNPTKLCEPSLVSAAIDDELASSSDERESDELALEPDVHNRLTNAVNIPVDLPPELVSVDKTKTSEEARNISNRDAISADIDDELASSDEESETSPVPQVNENRKSIKNSDAISAEIYDELDPHSTASATNMDHMEHAVQTSDVANGALNDELAASDKDTHTTRVSGKQQSVNLSEVICSGIDNELASIDEEVQSNPRTQVNEKSQTENAPTNKIIATSPAEHEIEAVTPAWRSDLGNELPPSFQANPRERDSGTNSEESAAQASEISSLVSTAIDDELASSSSEDDETEPTKSDQVVRLRDSNKARDNAPVVTNNATMPKTVNSPATTSATNPMRDMADQAPSSPHDRALPTESTSIWAQVMKSSMPTATVSQNAGPLGSLSDSTSDSSSDSSDDSSDSDADDDEENAMKTLTMPLHSKPSSKEADTNTRVDDEHAQDIAQHQTKSSDKPKPPLPKEIMEMPSQNQDGVVSASRKRSNSNATTLEKEASPTKKHKLLPEKPTPDSTMPVPNEVSAQTTTINSAPAAPVQNLPAPKQSKPEPMLSVNDPHGDFAKVFQKLISRQENEKVDDHYVARTIAALKKSSVKAEPEHVAKLCRVLADEYRNRHISPLGMVNGALRAFLAMRKGYSLNIDEPHDLSDMCLQVLLRLIRTTNRLHESMITEKRIALMECLSVLHRALWTSTSSTTALDSFTSSSKLSGATQVGFQHDSKATKHYVYLAYACAFYARLCAAVESSERVYVLAFDIVKHSPTILGLYLVRTIMTVMPRLFQSPELTFLQETIEHAMLLIANQSADERELIGDESSMMILSSIASMVSRDALSAAIEEDPRRAQKTFVNRIWMQEIDELVSCEATASESEYSERSFELGKCMELLAVVYDLDFVTRSFSVERFQTVFNECEAANGNGRILLVQLAGSIASVVAAKLPDDASVAYVDTIGSWMQQLLRSPSENEPTYPQLQLACVSVCVDLVLALASAKSVVGIWWWSALHWAEQQPTETMWEFSAEFLRRFRLAVLATSKANEVKAEK